MLKVEINEGTNVEIQNESNKITTVLSERGTPDYAIKTLSDIMTLNEIKELFNVKVNSTLIKLLKSLKSRIKEFEVISQEVFQKLNTNNWERVFNKLDSQEKELETQKETIDKFVRLLDCDNHYNALKKLESLVNSQIKLNIPLSRWGIKSDPTYKPVREDIIKIIHYFWSQNLERFPTQESIEISMNNCKSYEDFYQYVISGGNSGMYNFQKYLDN